MPTARFLSVELSPSKQFVFLLVKTCSLNPFSALLYLSLGFGSDKLEAKGMCFIIFPWCFFQQRSGGGLINMATLQWINLRRIKHFSSVCPWGAGSVALLHVRTTGTVHLPLFKPSQMFTAAELGQRSLTGLD